MVRGSLSKIRIVLIRFLSTLLLIIDVVRKKYTNQISKNGHSHLLNSFYLFGGFINLSAARWLGNKKLSFANRGLLSKFSDQEMREAAKHLKKEGYVVFENVLQDELCTEILSASEVIPGISRVMDDGSGKSERLLFDRRNPKSVRFDYSGSDLISNSVLQKIIFDESILNFAQEYLGSAPIMDLVAMWWHTTFSSRPDKEAAQWFHFDMDRLKWVKFFFYITDVDSNTGPHTFIAQSHRSLGIPYRLRSKGYARLTDEEVSDSFEKHQYKEFVGKRGTLIVEDTRGLHKGKHCLTGDRLLFQLEFTSSEFGTPIPQFTIEKKIDRRSQVGTILESYPSVFQTVQYLIHEPQ